jgi:rSAM/selenodomain-associated transferase 2
MNKIIFSIIIPVYKEEKIINKTIENLQLFRSEKFEIIVVDGEKSGSTLKNIKNIKIKKIHSEKGRGIQMNKGAEKAKGEILVFLHADTILPENALTEIKNVIYDKRFSAGAFDLGINSNKTIFRVIEFISSIRSRLTRIPYGDQSFFLRKKFFLKIGGFKDFPIMEDVELMQRIKRIKCKIKIIHEKVLTSPRRWEKEGILFCTLRNWFLIILYFLGKSPEDLIKYYKGTSA